MPGWNPSQKDVDKFLDGFQLLLARDDAHRRVETCLDSTAAPHRAGLLYSELEPVTADALELSDWVAVTLLDMTTSPRAFRGIQLDEERRKAIEAGLTSVRDVPLVDASKDDLDAANTVYSHLRYEDPDARTPWGIGRVGASKLLARKRPALIPIVDTRMLNWFGHPRAIWAPMREALRQKTDGGITYFNALDRHLRRSQLTRGISVLRAIDIAAWELVGSPQNRR